MQFNKMGGEMNMFEKFASMLSIRAKLLLIFLIILIPGFFIMGYQETRLVSSFVENQGMEKARSDMNMGIQLIDTMYPGDWKNQKGQLYKGDKLINGNSDLVDLITRLTGDSISLFVGDTRVATSTIRDGKRAVGTKADENVTEAVLRKGETFIGKANVAGRDNFAAYTPLKDAGGTIIGIFGVGLEINETIVSAVHNAEWQIIILAVIEVLLTVVLIYFSTIPLVRRLKRVSGALQQVANGDLTVEKIDVNTDVPSKDEIVALTTSYNVMTEHLRRLIKGVEQTLKKLTQSSEGLSASVDQTKMTITQVSAAIHQVALGADQQMKGANNTTDSVREMSIGIQRIADHSSVVVESSIASAKQANEGNLSVKKAVAQMDSIHQSVIDFSVTIKQLKDHSQEIERFVEVIRTIAEQTNLLALNAAIEAARAGEHGRGFSVVADEVRKLAVQSAKSAEQIEKLIQMIQGKMVHSVEAMEKVSQEVQSGIHAVEDTSHAFTTILESAQQVAAQIQEISASTEQLAAGSHEITSSLEQMAQIAKDAANRSQEVSGASDRQLASIEKISLSATALSKMAKELEELIRRFKL